MGVVEQQIIAIVHDLQPGEKLREIDIANRLGITRQYAHQTIKKFHLEKKLVKWTLKEPKRCEVCGKKISLETKRMNCVECEKLLDASRNKFICPVCGTEFHVASSRIKYEEKHFPGRKHFCSHKCRGVDAGKRYGFGKSKISGEI